MLIMMLLISSTGWTANEWRNTLGSGFIDGDVVYFNDIDTEFNDHILEPLDRLLINSRFGMKLTYSSGSTLVVGTGSIVCTNAGGTINKIRRNTSTTNVTFSDIDTGSEAPSTQYYLYSNCDADATTATFKISTSASAPSGLTYYRKMGSFYNNVSSDMEQITNDDDSVSIVTGTVSNGATISLPSGYSQSECNWTVAVGAITHFDGGDGNSLQNITATADTSRVATCTVKDRLAVTVSTTCNYIIACHR